MEYRRLGKTGLKLSALSFGAWITFGRQLGLVQVKELLSVAYGAGVNFFDNAEGYANGEAENLMGEALQQLGYSRDSWCVSSKVFFGSAEKAKPTQKGLSRKHIFEACHQALVRLRVDYLDLYFCHRPDPEVGIEEIVWSMHQLVMQGKVLYWGTSEWAAKDILAAQDFAVKNHLIPPMMEQPQYNLLARDRVENEYLPVYQGAQGLGTTIWSPLASGLLSGKYTSFEQFDENYRFGLPGLEWLQAFAMGETKAQKFQQIQRLAAVAKEAGVPLAQLCVAWCLRNPNVSTVILGASKREQLEQNLATISIKLAPEVFKAAERALLGL
jgi:voltage-dependent potassium channel beta subunit